MKFVARMWVAFLAVALASSSVAAQGPARGRVEPLRDEALEAQARHNLDVARYYLTRRKAYEGARSRLQEILDTYPEFSRADEVLFLMGEAYLKLDKKDEAAEHFGKMIEKFPASEFVKKAQARLDELKGVARARDKTKG
jgi:outer membrane protein assembly factor BamD (BamD/ComL family)